LNSNVSTYLTQQVMTASPAKLVSMLYDKLLISLKETIAAIEKGEIEARWKANARATEIISHMWSTLDREKGGEIAKNLDGMFSFILMRLPDIDMRNDPEPAREAIGLLEPIAESWRVLARGGAAQPAAAPAAAPAGAEPPAAPIAMPTSLSA